MQFTKALTTVGGLSQGKLYNQIWLYIEKDDEFRWLT